MNGQYQHNQQQFQHGNRGGFQMQGGMPGSRGAGARGRGRGMGGPGRINNMGQMGVAESGPMGGETGFNVGFGGGYGDDGGGASYYGAYNSQGVGASNKMMGGQQGGPMRRPYQKRNFNQAFTPY